MNFRKLNYTEPVVLRGIVAAVVALLAAVGFTVNADLTDAAEAAIVGFATIWPVAQALWTRFSVWSPKGKDAAVDKARSVALRRSGQVPGVADHAAPE